MEPKNFRALYIVLKNEALTLSGQNFTKVLEHIIRKKIHFISKTKSKFEQEKLLAEKLYGKTFIDSSDQNFLSRIAISVKENQSIKLVLDLKIFNISIHKT